VRRTYTIGFFAALLLLGAASRVAAQGLPITEFDRMCSSKRNHYLTTVLDRYQEVVAAQGDEILTRRTFDYFNETDANGRGALGFHELRNNMDALLDEADARGARNRVTVGEAFLFTLRENLMYEPPGLAAFFEGIPDVPC